jgi:hypothetical protein
MINLYDVRLYLKIFQVQISTAFTEIGRMIRILRFQWDFLVMYGRKRWGIFAKIYIT